MAGNISASSLVKSAASTASAIADYKDKLAAMEWDNSAQTDTDYQKYSEYLTSRIERTSKINTLSGASKTATLTNTLKSANRSFVSNTIQRASIDVMEGRLTATDKLEQIRYMYNAAINNGDENLAQNLRSQYDTLDMQIQNDAIAAAKAYEANVKADKEAAIQGDEDAIKGIKRALSNLSWTLKQGGQQYVSEAGQEYVDSIRAYAGALGIDIPEGATVSNGGLITAAISAIAQITANQADIYATMPGYSLSYRNKYDEATAIYEGTAEPFNVGGTNFTYKTAKSYQENPSMYYMKTTGADVYGNPTQTLVQKAINGFDSQGNPIYATTDVADYMNTDTAEKTIEQAKKDLVKAGFTVKGTNDDGTINIQATADETNQYFQKTIKEYGVAPNSNFRAYITDKGYQLKLPGSNQSLTIAKDKNSLFGIYKNDAIPGTGTTTQVAGQYGFNQQDNTVITPIAPITPKYVNPITNPIPLQTYVQQQKAQTAPQLQKYAPGSTYSNFIGNNDWRGYLNYLAKSGDTDAATALKFVGNDNKYTNAPLYAMPALEKFGAVSASTFKPVKPITGAL